MLGHFTYLYIILIPGITALVTTWILGRKILFKRVKIIFLIVTLLTFYLVAIDNIAIHTLKIWSFRKDSVTDIWIAGDYLEEWILFIITQTIIVSWAFILKYQEKIVKSLDH
jgi:lycopene cyclase domain-containing protein